MNPLEYLCSLFIKVCIITFVIYISFLLAKLLWEVNHTAAIISAAFIFSIMYITRNNGGVAK